MVEVMSYTLHNEKLTMLSLVSGAILQLNY